MLNVCRPSKQAQYTITVEAKGLLWLPPPIFLSQLDTDLPQVFALIQRRRQNSTPTPCYRLLLYLKMLNSVDIVLTATVDVPSIQKMAISKIFIIFL